MGTIKGVSKCEGSAWKELEAGGSSGSSEEAWRHAHVPL